MSSLKEIKAMNLKSDKVFDYFCKIASIPHGSRNTKGISDYLVSFAKDHELEYYQDDKNNVVIIKEATEGYENAEPVIIQGHMDMVCEKENDCDIDFEKDGLRLYVDGDYLKAEGTTLGGDDGVAVAYALAIMDSPEISHPRLEAVITVDEEIGMLGANAIDLSMLKGHMMLNIDSDEEGHFLTSCAGGMTVNAVFPVERCKGTGDTYEIKVTGLYGGHSGSEIDKELGNANILMGRVLKSLRDEMPYGLITLSGGLKDNAIPRECVASIIISPEYKDTLYDTISSVSAIYKKEYAASDPDVSVVISPVVCGTCADVLSASSFTKVIMYLRNVPNGVQHMSRVMDGLVETSLNCGIMNMTDDSFLVTTSVRSCVSSRKSELADRIITLTEFLGGSAKVEGDYPAWEYRSSSVLRDKISGVYKELYGKEPVFEAVHAGLECGILSDKIKDLDCVSFGPDNHDIHTPRERLSISSTERVYIMITELLKRLK